MKAKQTLHLREQQVCCVFKAQLAVSGQDVRHFPFAKNMAALSAPVLANHLILAVDVGFQHAFLIAADQPVSS